MEEYLDAAGSSFNPAAPLVRVARALVAARAAALVTAAGRARLEIALVAAEHRAALLVGLARSRTGGIDAGAAANDADREHAEGESHSLVAMAKTAPMRDVMDLMIAALGESESSEDADEAAAPSKLAYKTLGLSKRFSTLEEQLDWLEGVETDAQLVNKLETELDLKKPDDHKQKRFGAERLHRAADWIKNQSSEAMKGRISELGKRALDHAKTDLEFVRSDFKGTLSDIKRVPGAAKKSVKVVREAGRRQSALAAFA